MTRVALAFSGGLDTTVCVPLLKEEYGYDEVIGVNVDVGQPTDEFDEAEETQTRSDSTSTWSTRKPNSPTFVSTR